MKSEESQNLRRGSEFGRAKSTATDLFLHQEYGAKLSKENRLLQEFTMIVFGKIYLLQNSGKLNVCYS